MDDRDLELRLRTHLHRRFDDAPVPAGLSAAVLAGLRTQPQPVRFDLRLRRLLVGWSAVAALAVVVVVFLLYGSINGPIPPGGTGSPGPSASAGASRDFIVLPPTGAIPSKAASTLASDVMAARMRALGFGNFSSGGGYAIEFQLPADGAADAAVRRVLTATGDVAFVPLPADDYYGETGLEAAVGKPLPKAEPALFGWEGIASVGLGSETGSETQSPDPRMPSLDFTLTPAAAAAFGDYTLAHVAEYFAIVVDGTVVAVPVIQGPIPGGEVTITGGSLDDETFAEAAAILVGGLLPEEWRKAVAPEILSRDAAIEKARASLLRSGVDGAAEATVESAGLEAQQGGGSWEPIWTVVFERANNGPMQVIVDARPGQ